MAKTIDEIRESFDKLLRIAGGKSSESFMSIPPRPEHDADLIVNEAINELENLRKQRTDYTPAERAQADADGRELHQRWARVSGAVDPLFTVHMLNEVGRAKAGQIASEFTQLLRSLETLCGKDGRDFALVKTKLQEASFFAKRAMAERKEHQEP